MIHPIWIVAFAGHRPGAGPGRTQSDLVAARPRIEEVLKQISTQAEAAGGKIELLTSVAAGADIEAAEVARELGIPIHVILPKTVDSFHEDFDGQLESYWPRAQQLIETAMACEGDGSFRFSKGALTSPDCYHDTSMQMLRFADVAIAVWNRQPSAGIGGTQEFVEEARRMAIPVAVIDPSKQVAPEYQGEWPSWPKPDKVITTLNKNVFEADQPTTQPASKDLSKTDTSEWFKAFDMSANHYGGQFRKGLKTSALLHFIAGLLAAINASYSSYFHGPAHPKNDVAQVATEDDQSQATNITATEDPSEKTSKNKEHAKHPKSKWRSPAVILTSIELILVLTAIFLLIRSILSHDHHKWRQSRFAAELLRGSEPSIRHLDPLTPLVARHEPSWYRFALSTGLATHHRVSGARELEEQKSAYLKDRICDQRDRYFNKMQPAAHKWNWRLSNLGLFTAWAAPLFVAIALLLKLWDPAWIDGSMVAPLFTKFFPILLPLIAGIGTTLVIATDSGRRAERYQNLGDRLEQLARLIPGIKTTTALSGIVYETEEILLDELVEWHTASQNAGH